MNDPKDYIDVLVQAPLAVILMGFILLVFRLLLKFMKDVIKILKNKD